MIVAGVPLRITYETSTDSGWSTPAAIIPTPSSKSTTEQNAEIPITISRDEATGFLGRPGPEQRAENRARMLDDTGDAFVKWGMVAGTLLFSPNPIMKVLALVQALGIEDQPVGG